MENEIEHQEELQEKEAEEENDDLLARLKKELKEKDEIIAKLRNEIDGFQAGNFVAAKSNQRIQPHSGKWTVDTKLQEFIALDSGIKQELRKEKNLRITRVNTELSWIVDSDDITQLKGKWSCCGDEEHQSNRGCQKAN